MLTVLSLVIQGVFFALCVWELLSIRHQQNGSSSWWFSRVFLEKNRSIAFTTLLSYRPLLFSISFTLTVAVSILFFGMSTLFPHSIIPSTANYPHWLSLHHHFITTVMSVYFHRLARPRADPNRNPHLLVVVGLYLTYMILCGAGFGAWPYPFQEQLSLLGHVTFISCALGITVLSHLTIGAVLDKPANRIY
jgi:hypothetical protein